MTRLFNVFREERLILFDRGRTGGFRCNHLDQIHDIVPRTNGCEECLMMGDDWVHLRLCLICGHVGCCDNSKNKHAKKHYHATEHPLIRSFEPGETWRWCFVDQVFL